MVVSYILLQQGSEIRSAVIQFLSAQFSLQTRLDEAKCLSSLKVKSIQSQQDFSYNNM